MKRLSLGVIAAVAAANLTLAAFAADLPVKAPPMLPPAFSWTGFYVGGYYGEALGSQVGSTPVLTTGSHSGVTNVNQIGPTLGVTAGYNWQFAPHWLVGLEGDLGWLGLDQTNIEFNDITFVGVKTDWYATARARFGYVTGPSLLYVTGGAAFVHTTDTFGGVPALAGLTPVPSTISTITRTSWTAGAGIETQLSRAWTTKTEYLFIDGGASNNFLANPRGIAGVPSIFNHNFNVIKTGLNYHIGAPGNEGLFAFITAPPMPSDHDWRGFYVGGNIGGGLSNVDAMQGYAAGLFPGRTQINGSGFAGGGQAGYNFIFGSRWFAGVEGDIGVLRIGAEMNDGFDEEAQFNASTNWYGTARVRFGVTTGPALLYVTGGAAWVNSRNGFIPIPSAPTATNSTTTGSGYAIGGGTEVALDARWSAKLEALYIDTGDPSIHLIAPPSTFGASFKDHFLVARAGLNFKLW
jgi:outer membrane immunogenic protein